MILFYEFHLFHFWEKWSKNYYRRGTENLGSLLRRGAENLGSLLLKGGLKTPSSRASRESRKNNTVQSP